MGDAGWVPGQLEGELGSGTWALLAAPPAALDLFGSQAASQAPAATGGGGGPAGALLAASLLKAAAATDAAQQYEQQVWSRLLG